MSNGDEMQTYWSVQSTVRLQETPLLITTDSMNTLIESLQNWQGIFGVEVTGDREDHSLTTMFTLVTEGTYSGADLVTEVISPAVSAVSRALQASSIAVERWVSIEVLNEQDEPDPDEDFELDDETW